MTPSMSMKMPPPPLCGWFINCIRIMTPDPDSSDSLSAVLL
jgi:hypothetical protein